MENTTQVCAEAETKEIKSLLLIYQDVFAQMPVMSDASQRFPSDCYRGCVASPQTSAEKPLSFNERKNNTCRMFLIMEL